MTCSECKDGKAVFLDYPLRYLDIECPYQDSETGCTTCNKAAVIRKKIDAKVEEIRTLTQELADVRDEANMTHNRITQVLPTEVISEIFSLYVSSEEEDGHCRPYSEQPLPGTRHNRQALKLGQISKVLRNIARNTPRIWTNVVIVVDCDCLDKYLDLLRDFFSRSGSLPLNIWLYSSSWKTSPWNKKYSAAGGLEIDQTYDRDYISGQFSNLVDVIAQSSHRWFRLVTDIHMDLVSYLLKVAQDVSNLKEMEFQDAGGLRSRPNDFQMFGNPIPSPQSVNIQGELVFSHFNIDWTRVTFLKIGSLTSQSFLSILQACPLLESLAVSWSGYYNFALSSPGSPSSPLHITHSVLRHLSISFGYNHEEESISLSKVTFTRLCELEIYLGNHIDREHLDYLIEFYRRSSSASLQKMTLVFYDAVDTQMITEIFRSCPSLVYLMLRVYGAVSTPLQSNLWANHFAQSTAVHVPSISHEPLLPLLEVMELRMPTPQIAILHTLLDILDAFPSVPEGTMDYNQPPKRRPLKILTLCTYPLENDGDIVRLLLRFRESGVKVKWMSYDESTILLQ